MRKIIRLFALMSILVVCSNCQKTEYKKYYCLDNAFEVEVPTSVPLRTNLNNYMFFGNQDTLEISITPFICSFKEIEIAFLSDEDSHNVTRTDSTLLIRSSKKGISFKKSNSFYTKKKVDGVDYVISVISNKKSASAIKKIAEHVKQSLSSGLD